MDRYFYSIEDYGSEKEVYVSGNVYFNDVDETETDHRIAEWTGFCLSLEQVKELIDEECLLDYINERVNYLGDITKEEAEDICNTYWSGEPGIELDIKNVTDDTPRGYYWFEVC